MDELHLVIAHALNHEFITNKDIDLPQDDRKRKILKGTPAFCSQVIFANPQGISVFPFEIWVAMTFEAFDTDHAYYHEWTFPLEFLTDDCEVLDPS